MPRSWSEPVARVVAQPITPLVAPLTEPTQTVPNKAPLSKEFDADALAPTPRVQIPPSAPSTTRPAAGDPRRCRRRARRPRRSLPSRRNGPFRAAGRPGGRPSRPGTGGAAPDPGAGKAQAGLRESLRSQHSGSGNRPGASAGSRNTIAEAVRSVARGGPAAALPWETSATWESAGSGRAEPAAFARPAGQQPGTADDPQGVDFRPYLIKILASVRRNWFAVMPESAKLGRQGRVGIQFAVARNGSVPKLVIVQQSGTDALDRAAVPASAPPTLSPLPTEFKGSRSGCSSTSPTTSRADDPPLHHPGRLHRARPAGRLHPGRVFRIAIWILMAGLAVKTLIAPRQLVSPSGRP